MQTWNLGTKSWNLGILESLYAVKCPSRASSEEMSIAKKTRITQISCWCLAQDKWTRTLSLSEPKSIIVDWYVEPSGLASWMVCLFILPVDHYCAFGEVQQITKRQWNWILSKEIPNVSKQSLVKTAMSWIVYCPPRLYEFFCSSIQVEVSTLLLALVRFVFRIASSYPNNLHPRQRKHNIHRDNQISIFLSILLLLLLLLYQYNDYKKNTSSTAQGGGSFKDWKSIGEVSCRGVRSLTSKLLQFPIRKHLPIISRHKSRHLSRCCCLRCSDNYCRRALSAGNCFAAENAAWAVFMQTGQNMISSTRKHPETQTIQCHTTTLLHSISRKKNGPKSSKIWKVRSSSGLWWGGKEVGCSSTFSQTNSGSSIMTTWDMRQEVFYRSLVFTSRYLQCICLWSLRAF